MLHSLLLAPFDDPARQAWYETVQAALQAETVAPATLLLGNLVADTEELDALILRPHSVTVLQFGVGSRQITENELLPLLEQFRRQQQAAAAWLGDSLSAEPVRPEQVTGLVVFAAPVTFGANVEQFLRTQPGTDQFQLLSTAQQVPRRLPQLATAEVQLLEAEFPAWYQQLTEASINEPEVEPGFWEQNARKLWRWLGAEDIPHDAPYGGATVAASQEEKERLEQLRQQVRDELLQQRQQMEAREAEREQSIAQLRAQLTETPSATAEVAALQARLATETREKQQLEAAIQASRQEAAARNQELDARIQQLGHLIQQLQTAPPAAAPAPPAQQPRTAAASPAAQPKPMAMPPVSAATARPAAPVRPAPNLLPRQSQWQLQWPRVALVVAAAGILGMGAWGMVRFSDRLLQEPRPRRAVPQQPTNDNTEAAAPTLFDIQPDTIQLEVDKSGAEMDSARAAESAIEEPPAPQQGEVMDSTSTELPEGI